MKSLISSLLFIFIAADPSMPPKQIVSENRIEISTLDQYLAYQCQNCNKQAQFKVVCNGNCGYFCQEHAAVTQEYKIRLVFDGKQWGIEQQ